MRAQPCKHIPWDPWDRPMGALLWPVGVGHHRPVELAANEAQRLRPTGARARENIPGNGEREHTVVGSTLGSGRGVRRILAQARPNQQVSEGGQRG
eukprot:8593772-Pyramimonas_sp.AAC.1